MQPIEGGHEGEGGEDDDKPEDEEDVPINALGELDGGRGWGWGWGWGWEVVCGGLVCPAFATAPLNRRFCGRAGGRGGFATAPLKRRFCGWGRGGGPCHTGVGHDFHPSHLSLAVDLASEKYPGRMVMCRFFWLCRLLISCAGRPACVCCHARNRFVLSLLEVSGT